MRTAAILPVKRFSLAKQRLGASLADSLRLELAQAMVADVMLALAETERSEVTMRASVRKRCTIPRFSMTPRRSSLTAAAVPVRVSIAS